MGKKAKLQIDLAAMFEKASAEQNNGHFADCLDGKIVLGKAYILNDPYEEPHQEGLYGVSLDQIHSLSDEEKTVFADEQKAKLKSALDTLSQKYTKYLAQKEHDLIQVKQHFTDYPSSDAERRIADATTDRDMAQLQMFITIDSEIEKFTNPLMEAGEVADVVIKRYFDEKSADISRMQDSYLAKNAPEVKSMGRICVNAVHGKDTVSLKDVPEGSIIFAKRQPTPQQMGELRNPLTGESRAKALCFVEGGMNTHTILVATSMDMEVARVHESIFEKLRPEDECILSGPSEKLYIAPSQDQIELYQAAQAHQIKTLEMLDKKSMKSGTVKSLDGRRVTLGMNYAALPVEKLQVANEDAYDLVRTELLPPEGIDPHSLTIKDWKEYFRGVITAPKGVSDDPYIAARFRTADIKGDKIVSTGELTVEEYERQITQKQLTALLKLKRELQENGHEDIISVMVPNIESREHYESLQKTVDDIAARLVEEEGGTIENTRIVLDSMFEIPSFEYDIAYIEANGISIGTNDLSHAMTHVDRYSKESKKVDMTNPAFLSCIERTAEACERTGKDLSVCGDMASSPEGIVLLMGCGVTHFSSRITRIPLMKEVIRRTSITEAEQLVFSMKGMGQDMRHAALKRFMKDRVGMIGHGLIDDKWKKPETSYEPELVA